MRKNKNDRDNQQCNKDESDPGVTNKEWNPSCFFLFRLLNFFFCFFLREEIMNHRKRKPTHQEGSNKSDHHCCCKYSEECTCQSTQQCEWKKDHDGTERGADHSGK